MNAPARTFEAKLATRQRVPLLVGLVGPSGGGKTYSALRLATGMQQVSGGDIYVVDTEARRSLHYADRFKFQHIEFTAPFGSLDYLEVMKFCVAKGAHTIIIDSCSHEHEGPGGYLFTHAAELDRIAGQDMAKRDKNNFTAWIKPAGERRALINGMLQLNANFLFCFRAKDKLKIVGGGKPVELGFMPIAGDEFVYEMTLSALLYPGARGVPTWNSTLQGERSMVKLPEQFRALFEGDKAMDEATGRALAQWAAGSSIDQTVQVSDLTLEAGETAAKQGMSALQAWFKALPKTDQVRLKPTLDDRLKAVAKAVDEADAKKDAFGLDPIERAKPAAGEIDDARIYLNEAIAKLQTEKSTAGIEGMDAGVQNDLKGRDDFLAEWIVARDARINELGGAL